MSERRAGFTLIELLVVVAIIALLISILLPSLNKARDQAKAAVCATRLRSFGQASALYETEFKSFAPCDPWYMMYDDIDGDGRRDRNPNNWQERADPAHGYLALFGLKIRPHIADPGAKPWEAAPFGFNIQSSINPEDLWEGFFCPAQNLRNTTDIRSGELDPFHHHEGYPTRYRHGSAYMVNRHLRSATDLRNRQGVRWPARPNPQFEAFFSFGGADDNIFGASGQDGVQIEIDGRYQFWHTQATVTDEVIAPADIMYMCDSLDYHLESPTGSIPYQGTGNWSSGSEQSAGLWYNPYPGGTSDRQHVVLGSRHGGKANVLYADSHVGRDNQVARDRRGDLITASTFADYTEEHRFGTQHHLAPFWRRVR